MATQNYETLLDAENRDVTAGLWSDDGGTVAKALGAVFGPVLARFCELSSLYTVTFIFAAPRVRFWWRDPSPLAFAPRGPQGAQHH